ncbi:hypothetical protein [Floridanema evergladense]|uniref:Uncharacterized protein n=1 Tax=Floridaenema evergladense BLCC-F167 TaxID=3153639 RepID=A0ABV4WDI3_9CYAN
MTKSKGMGRGSNPASHRNKPKLGDEHIRFHVCLLPHQKQSALELGNGNASDGIRKALDICNREYHIENPTKLVLLLTLAQASAEPTKSELIAQALDYLENWSIERSWEKVKAETVTKTKNGAFII